MQCLKENPIPEEKRRKYQKMKIFNTMTKKKKNLYLWKKER